MLTKYIFVNTCLTIADISNTLAMNTLLFIKINLQYLCYEILLLKFMNRQNVLGLRFSHNACQYDGLMGTTQKSINSIRVTEYIEQEFHSHFSSLFLYNGV